MDALARAIMLTQLGWDLENLICPTDLGNAVYERIPNSIGTIRYVGEMDEN
jgi:hypothetical protein